MMCVQCANRVYRTLSTSTSSEFAKEISLQSNSSILRHLYLNNLITWFKENFLTNFKRSYHFVIKKKTSKTRLLKICLIINLRISELLDGH